jgi:hypothetical protein
MNRSTETVVFRVVVSILNVVTPHYLDLSMSLILLPVEKVMPDWNVGRCEKYPNLPRETQVTHFLSSFFSWYFNCLMMMCVGVKKGHSKGAQKFAALLVRLWKFIKSRENFGSIDFYLIT